MRGVAVVAPHDDAVRVGTVVTVEIRGASGEAIIRRIHDIDSACVRYGMEYRQLVGDFHEIVSDLVAGAHKQFDWQWTIAR